MSAALAAAVLLLAVLAGSAAASASLGALSDPFVGPRTGTPATVIRFSVVFQGHDAHSSAHVTVLIDDVAREMSPAGGAGASGTRYRFSTSLPVGTHVVVFRGDDGSTSASLAAGLVTIHVASTGDPAVPPATTAPGTSRPNAGTGGGTQAAGQPAGDTGGTTAPAEPPAATPAPAMTGGSHDGAGSPPDSATGGTQATHDDASGAADHPTSGPGGGPASGGSPAGVPPAAGAETAPGAAPAGSSGTSTLDILAMGVVAGTFDGGSGGPGGRLDDRTLSLLTGSGHDIPPATRMLIAAISATTTTTAVVAFFMFGKRRRDGEPPAPDAVLAANAGTFSTIPASALVPIGMPGAGPVDEAGIPRWRRPSLIQARKTDPRYSAIVAHDRRSFDHGVDQPAAGAERRLIRYRAVSLLDAPDPLRSSEIGDLDEGDEVQLLERSGGYWLVLCPDGNRGWVHRMTLGDIVTDESGPAGSDAGRPSLTTRTGGTEGTEGAGAAAEAADADRSVGEDGTDFLADYLRRARHS